MAKIAIMGFGTSFLYQRQLAGAVGEPIGVVV